MSFILDALRKVDQEKRASSESAPPIVGIDRVKQERFRRRRDFALIAGVAVLSAVATAFLLRRGLGPEPGAPILDEPLPAASAPAVPEAAPIPEPEAAPTAPTTAPNASPPTEVEAPSETEGEAVSGPPEDPLAIRVVGEASPSRSISSPVRETPVATDPSDLPPELSRLVLQGTSVLAGRPVAVVSDRRVFEGDRIEGATVIRIGERSVELEFQGRRFTLTL